jgi:CheY-like chemotaxis protein
MARRKILIVEDSLTTRSVVKVYLAGHAFVFVEAQDGLAGFRLAQEERPSAIVLDLKLPGMDGFTFCREVRADPVLKHTPVILLTGTRGDQVRREAMAAGATFFLTKPIDGAALAECILASLGGDAGHP